MAEPARIQDPPAGPAPVAAERPRVVYILGAGRSGTTLLDVLLGSARDGFSCGEVRKFMELDGRPRRVEPGSPCWHYWDGVRAGIHAEFDAGERRRLAGVIPRLEAHAWFLPNYLGVAAVTGADRMLYRRYVNRFFAVAARRAGAGVLVDSSKYPGRLLALLDHLEAPLDVVYLRRGRRDVVRSFGKRDVEQPPKGALAANTYYLTTHAMCALAYARVPEERRIRVDYDALLHTPDRTLEAIGARFGIDLAGAAETARRGGDFRVGHLFDGNRIRHEPVLALRPGPERG